MYALHLNAPIPRPYEDDDAYRAATERAARLLREADAVVVGIGSGMSTACGYDFYRRIDAFDSRFSRFEQAHGISSLMEGFYHAFSTNEERWAFLAECIVFLEECPIGSAYESLERLLAGKPYTVITTNVDGQVRRAFPDERTWLFQGDFGYVQCSQPCCSDVAYAVPRMQEICAAMGHAGLAAPSDMLPRCPRCGWLMVPWVRDDAFAERGRWKKERGRYESFVADVLDHAAKVVFMELGVGGMTPSIIEIPFWRMVAGNENAFYLRVNAGKSGEPQQLLGRSLTITADLAVALEDMAREQ